MATLSPTSATPRRRPKRWARKVERCCCNTLTYFPLVFVYGLTSWACWVAVNIGKHSTERTWTGTWSAGLSFFLYCMLNWCYTTAVFTDPGSPLEPYKQGGYSQVPTAESRPYTSFTVKSSGELRFCKKCQARKPDRAHHCSTCRRCVLKMDHHCPWLATCVGLRNYKPFLLFLIYVSLFCWVCFFSSIAWLWQESISTGRYEEDFMPINYILLAVLSGIIGLVISGFTGWHVWLCSRGQTTIESLEKTRYLSPLRKSYQQHLDHRNYVTDPDVEANPNNSANSQEPSIGEQLLEIHANAIPGVTRPEEGVSPSTTPTPFSPSSPYSNPSNRAQLSPAQRSLASHTRSPLALRQQQQRQADYDRYQAYLDERDSESLPHAFDLGWRRNLIAVLGPVPWLWALPICNSEGDGWRWEASQKWIEAREEVRRRRQEEDWAQRERERAAGWGGDDERGPYPGGGRAHRASWRSALEVVDGEPDGENRFLMTSDGVARVPVRGRRSPGKADWILGRRSPPHGDAGMAPPVPLQEMGRKRATDSDEYEYDYETSSDEERVAGTAEEEREAFLKKGPPPGLKLTRSGSRSPQQQQFGQQPGQQQQRQSSPHQPRPVSAQRRENVLGLADWNDVPEEMLASGGGRKGAKKGKGE